MSSSQDQLMSHDAAMREALRRRDYECIRSLSFSDSTCDLRKFMREVPRHLFIRSECEAQEVDELLSDVFSSSPVAREVCRDLTVSILDSLCPNGLAKAMRTVLELLKFDLSHVSQDSLVRILKDCHTQSITRPGNLACSELLLRCGVPIDPVGRERTPVLHTVAMFDETGEGVRQLLDAGANPTAVNTNGSLALEIAITNGREQAALELLRKTHARIDAREFSNYLQLLLLMRRGAPRLVRALCAACDDDGLRWDALFMICCNSDCVHREVMDPFRNMKFQMTKREAVVCMLRVKTESGADLMLDVFDRAGARPSREDVIEELVNRHEKHFLGAVVAGWASFLTPRTFVKFLEISDVLIKVVAPRTHGFFVKAATLNTPSRISSWLANMFRASALVVSGETRRTQTNSQVAALLFGYVTFIGVLDSQVSDVLFLIFGFAGLRIPAGTSHSPCPMIESCRRRALENLRRGREIKAVVNSQRRGAGVRTGLSWNAWSCVLDHLLGFVPEFIF